MCCGIRHYDVYDRSYCFPAYFIPLLVYLTLLSLSYVRRRRRKRRRLTYTSEVEIFFHLTGVSVVMKIAIFHNIRSCFILKCSFTSPHKCVGENNFKSTDDNNITSGTDKCCNDSLLITVTMMALCVVVISHACDGGHNAMMMMMNW